MDRLLRIGIFYDGQYFYNVSNYYRHIHAKKARISIGGLHEYIRHKVSENCDVPVNLCQIVDSHYFRGRQSAQVAKEKQLYNERSFDEILMDENIVAHYLPLKQNQSGFKEKGVDIWLALEAYELAMYKRFDVLVLIASDGDYVPLVRKLNTLGTRVMLLAWDFKYTDKQGNVKETKTAYQLLDEVSFPIKMHDEINDEKNSDKEIMKGLFLPPKGQSDCPEEASEIENTTVDDENETV